MRRSASCTASAWVYDAVVDADGVSGLDRPVLDWALGVRTPAAEYWVTAFTNLGKTVPMVILGLILTSLIPQVGLRSHRHRGSRDRFEG